MAQPPVTRMPTLNLPPFDGDSQNADRWLAMLKLDFGAGNIDSETHPQSLLVAIYTKTATITKVQIFEAEFRSRFPGRVAITKQASPFLYARSLKQEPHENLSAYIYQARELWSSAGGRRTTQMEPIYDMGCQVIVQGFVSGLYEEVVKFKAIENCAMGVTDLEEAISKVNAAVQTLQHNYLNDYYSRSNRPQSSAPPNFQIAQLQPLSQNSNVLAQSAPSWNSHNVSHPVISGQLLQLPQGNNMPQQQPWYEGPPRSSSEYTGNRPLLTKRELSQGYNPLLSRHPVCGELGHPSRDCPTPQALTYEEQTMLYNRYVDRVLASTQRQVNSADAYQFVYNQITPQNQQAFPNSTAHQRPRSPVPRVAGISVQNNEEDYGNYPTQTYEEATGQRETYQSRAGGDAVDSLEFGAQLMDEE
ncbi:hypothetical protein Golomagni_05585 [Golovinomyces magnicellulatus]|nr:hypothetical protein Golomagni_05585 [Golovinomyces magnicellulatus]